MNTMHRLIDLATLVVADAERFSNMGTRFRRGSSFSIWTVLFGLAAIAGLILLSQYLYKLYEQRAERVRHNPWSLFSELCKAHKLSWTDQWELRSLAKAMHLERPADLFIRRELFAGLKKRKVPSHQMARYQALRDKIFTAG